MTNNIRQPNSLGLPKPALWVAGAILAAGGADVALGQVPIPFDIVDGQVVPEVECAVRIEVLGCANNSSSHGGYARATTLKLHATDVFGTTVDLEPFGPFAAAVDGNVNDGQSHPFTFLTMFDPDTEFAITAQCWNWDGTGNANTDWSVRQTENSNADPDWVMVLRDGDIVPALPGFADQASVEDFLEPYMDIPTQTVALGPNDAIYLFELAAPSTASVYYDLQDLIVVITVQNSPAPSFD